MTSTHDSINGRLFYDPKAEDDGGNSHPPREFTGPTTTLSESALKTSEEIHRTLFSAR
ncbi:hypothetical protein GCM10027068_20660 [Prescottella soli]